MVRHQREATQTGSQREEVGKAGRGQSLSGESREQELSGEGIQKGSAHPSAGGQDQGARHV